ncbi:hypothetical protein ACQ4LE_005551 [Meloidogyne hapla]
MKNIFYFIIIFIYLLILNNISANDEEININLPVTFKKLPLKFKYGPSNKTTIVSKEDFNRGNIEERKYPKKTN